MATGDPRDHSNPVFVAQGSTSVHGVTTVSPNWPPSEFSLLDGHGNSSVIRITGAAPVKAADPFPAEITELLRSASADERIEKLTVDGKDVVLLVHQVSNEDLRRTLGQAIREAHAAASDAAAPYDVQLHSVYPGQVVFRKNGRLMRQDYRVVDREHGTVRLQGEPVEVRSITHYVDHKPHKSLSKIEKGDAAIAANEAAIADEPSDHLVLYESPDTEDAAMFAIKQLYGLTNSRSDRYAQISTDSEQRSSQAESKSEEIPMADETRKARIAQLLANEKSGYSAKDVPVLEELSDLAFEMIERVATAAPVVEAPAATETPAPVKAANAPPESENEPEDHPPVVTDETVSGDKPNAHKSVVQLSYDKMPPKIEKPSDAVKAVQLTAEQYIESLTAGGAPKEIVSMFQKGVEQEKTKRATLVASIRANKANIFTEAFLNTKDTDELEALAALAAAAAPAKPAPNYSGNGMHTFERPAATEEKPTLRMPSFGITIGGANKQ